MIFSKEVWIAAMVLGIAAPRTHAANTVLDGMPDVFDAIVLGDFDDNTTQGWTVRNSPTDSAVFLNSGVIGNNSLTADGDPQLNLVFTNATLPGVPSNVTIGNLPGQFDVVQFDLRLDVIPAAAVDSTATTGDQFFLVGGPNARAITYVNNGTGMGNNAGNVDTAPELQTDGIFHTYTVQRFSTDAGWGSTYSRIRVDPIGQPPSTGTQWSIDNVRIGRSNDVQPFTPFATPVPTNLVANSSFDDLTNPTPETGVGAWNINGSNGNFVNFQGNTVTVDSWDVYSEDPNNLIPAVNGGELDGSFYLDTHRRNNQFNDITLNSAEGYVNGMIQADILNGVTIDPSATYELTVTLAENPNTTQDQASFRMALTTGVGAAAVDTANAIAGSLLEITDLTTVPTAKTPFTVQVSGADLLTAQGNGPVNLIFESENQATIPNFPGGPIDPGDVSNTGIASQLLVDDLSLLIPFIELEGDVNKDGAVDQSDVDLAQLYLDGDGGQLAVDRQNTLISSGNAQADVLAALNLTDFDLTGDDFFDAADVAAIAALLGVAGDFNGDGFVNAADYTVWRDNLNSVEDGSILNGNGNNDGAVDAADYLLWRTNFGGPNTGNAGTAITTAPEPAAAMLVGLVLLAAAPSGRRR